MDPLPVEVVRFLDANIESIEQLEILRVLGEHPEREWPLEALAREAQTPVASLPPNLLAIESRGLLVLTSRDPLVCRYGPRTPELDNELKRLLQIYRERPVTLIRYVYSRGTDPLAAFADAFRLRKEP